MRQSAPVRICAGATGNGRPYRDSKALRLYSIEKRNARNVDRPRPVDRPASHRTLPCPEPRPFPINSPLAGFISRAAWAATCT